MSAHTQEHIALENYQASQSVHVEPALRAGDRFDGHFVQGHIDGVGVVKSVLKRANQVDIAIKAPGYFRAVYPQRFDRHRWGEFDLSGH